MFDIVTQHPSALGCQNGFAGLIDTFFSPDAQTYDNINMRALGFVTLRMVILGIALGIVVGTILSSLNRTFCGAFVRQMLDDGVVGREQAKSLAEMGLEKNRFVRWQLRRGYLFRRVVCSIEEEDYRNRCRALDEEAARQGRKPPKKYPPFSVRVCERHFYIPEEMRGTAEAKFGRRGSELFGVVLTVVLTVVMAALVCVLLPDALKLADELISSFKNR